MRIEFDSAKDAANLAKHGVSLRAAADFEWETSFEREDNRLDYGETRFVAIGLIGARVHVMVFTEGADDDGVRVISLRTAGKHEVRLYYDQV